MLLTFCSLVDSSVCHLSAPIQHQRLQLGTQFGHICDTFACNFAAIPDRQQPSYEEMQVNKRTSFLLQVGQTSTLGFGQTW